MDALRRWTEVDEWNVGLWQGPSTTELLRRSSWHARQVAWLLPSEPWVCHVDPFLETLPTGRQRLWTERYDYRTALGVLACHEIDGARDRWRAVPVAWLPRPGTPRVDVSYPNVMVLPDGRRLGWVEMAEAGRLDLFELEEERPLWRFLHSPLPDVPLLDPTVIRHGGRYWLFGSRLDRGAPHATLHLFHAPHPQGPWRPHAQQPVKRDPRSSRPAGDPFLVDGALYRPAQDCSRTYGGAVTILRVTALSPDAFEEEPVTVVRPDPRGAYPEGLHTLRRDRGRWLIDGKRRVHQRWAMPMKALARLRHARRTATLTAETGRSARSATG